jgi:phosphoribosylformylglycinamidine cyclo-ligase
MDQALAAAKKTIQKTATAEVLSSVGSFGGLHRSPGRHHLLATSIDGVGTKLKVAAMAGVHTTVGQDLVNHCVNDVLTQGARPLFFLDYIGAAKLDPTVFRDVVSGLSKACIENGCALIGGETAEMPGLYPDGEYDLVGTVVGAVRQADVVSTKSLKAGDRLIGLRSRGLHTNGYSLARRVLLQQEGLRLDDPLPGTKRTVGRILLDIHKSYLHPVMTLIENVRVHGMAHITGGGLIGNVPRALPDHLGADIDPSSWTPPAVFRFIGEAGAVESEEMYRVFNMGIGLVLIVPQSDLSKALRVLKESRERPVVIGSVVKKGPGIQFTH